MRALCHTLELLELTLPFPLSTRHRLLGDLPDKVRCQLKEAPGFAERFVTALQAHEEERGQDGQGSRASDTCSGLRHVPLPQCKPLFNAFMVTFTPQRHASMLSIAPALASVRVVTSIFTPFGPSVRRFLDKTIVTSPR